MKQSYYNYYFVFNGMDYVYNMLTTSIIKLDSQLRFKLENNMLDEIDNSVLFSLRSEGIIVEDDEEEYLKYQYYYDKTRYLKTSDDLTIMFIPTYGCNLRCTYCYQGKEKSCTLISKENIDKIITFVSNKIEECKKDSPIKTIHISLFGGEPLICKNEITYFCNEMKKIIDETNVKPYFDMTSNFTLVDDEVIELIKKYKINVQVSIDGNKEQHDQRRIRANKTGTYDLIIKNLTLMKNRGLKDLITIRVNVDNESIKSFKEMFKFLSEFSDDVYYALLTEYKKTNSEYSQEHTFIDRNCESNTVLNDVGDIYKKLNHLVPQQFGKKGPCAINTENKYFIDCYLDVYKCDLVVGKKECRIGYLNEKGELVQETNFYKQMNYSPFKKEKCLKCKYLPLCGGGCPAKHYLNSNEKNGDLSQPVCENWETKLKESLELYLMNL